MLSQLLWFLVVDGFRNLSDKGIYAQGYADDLAILVRGPFLDTLMELTLSALETMKEWCDNTDLSVNPGRSNLSYLLEGTSTFEEPALRGVRLALAVSVKYLEVILKTGWSTWRIDVRV